MFSIPHPAIRNSPSRCAACWHRSRCNWTDPGAWTTAHGPYSRMLIRTRTFRTFGEDGRLSVPTPAHYLPLLYIIAQQQGDEGVSVVTNGIEHGSIGMLMAAVGLASSEIGA
jgi:hypothetical protein